MCYSVKTSLLSYMLGLAAAIFALCTRQWALGMLILFYCQIQLGELMIWKGVDSNDKHLNKIGTSFTKFMLATHTMGLGLGILLSVIFVSKKKVGFIDVVPLLVGIIFFAVIVVWKLLPNNYPDVTFPKDRDCNCQNPNNRLEWKFPYSWYLYSALLSCVLVIGWVKPIASKIAIISFFALGLGLSELFFKKNVGTMWCFGSALLAPLIVIVNYFLTRNYRAI